MQAELYYGLIENRKRAKRGYNGQEYAVVVRSLDPIVVTHSSMDFYTRHTEGEYSLANSIYWEHYNAEGILISAVPPKLPFEIDENLTEELEQLFKVVTQEKLWWQVKEAQKKEMLHKVVALRSEVRKICGL